MSIENISSVEYLSKQKYSEFSGISETKIKQLLDDGVIEAIKPEVKVEVKPKTKEVPANG